MTEPADTHVLGMTRDGNFDRITRAMAGLVLAELTITVREHPTSALCDLAASGSVELCHTYNLDEGRYASPIHGHAIDHIASYLRDLEPPEPTHEPTPSAGCDRGNAERAARLDQLDSETRSALLRRISGDYEPVDQDSRSEVEQQIARYQRLYATIHGGVWRGLSFFGGLDGQGRRADAEAWRTAPLDDLVKAAMTGVRANLSPVFSDVIVTEALAFVNRHDRYPVRSRARTR